MKSIKHYFFTFLLLFILLNSISSNLFAEQTLLPEEQNTISIFKKVSPLVVNVHRYTTVVNLFHDVYEVPTGTASGFLWDKEGHVVTNYHVVQGVPKLAVTLQNGKVVEASVAGVAPSKDIAVLKLQSTKELADLTHNLPIELADSSQLQVGQKVVAIGNPFGLDNSLTEGIVSALGRRIRGIGGVMIHDMIQTDASINPGNSGGPLLNSTAQIIGMNTLIYSNSGSSAGVGFSVPSNTIKRIVSQIITHGHVIQPAMGVHTFSDTVAEQYGIDGVIIADIKQGSPAAVVGLQGAHRDEFGKIHFGDILIGIDGKRVKKFDDLYSVLETTKVGQTVEVEYLRDNKVKKVKLTLAEFAQPFD